VGETMSARWILIVVAVAACTPVEPYSRVPLLCPDRGEGLRVFASEGSVKIVNRHSLRVERIRYFTGWFDGKTEPTMDEIRRMERQLEISLEPGEAKDVEISLTNNFTRGGRPICLGVRAAPFELGGVRLSFDEAWAKEVISPVPSPSLPPAQ
jgi:hypothetical protein